MTFFNIYSKKSKEIAKPKITVDYREKNSLVPSCLISINCEVKFENLKLGDYIAGEIIIERKTISDLKSSILDGRISKQAANLENNNSILIIEGLGQKLYEGGIHENAIRGLILSLIVKKKIGIIWSINEEDTAKFIATLGKGRNRKNEHPQEPKLKKSSEEEEVRRILESFPGVGRRYSERLLKEFHSISNIFAQEDKEIRKILGNKTSKFKQLISKDFFIQ